MAFLQYISIFIEAVIAGLGVLIALGKGKKYGWGIFLTFAIYVFYDYVKMKGLNTSEFFLEIIFLIATVSMLYVAWNLFNDNKSGKRRR